MRLYGSTIVIFLALFYFSSILNAATQETFTKFRGPKPGQWLLSAKVRVPGAKEITQESNTCVKPGEDLKQRALGQLGDAGQGCVVSVTKDTSTVGALTSKCPSISASVEMTKISDNEFRYDVSSSMAKVITLANYKGPVCPSEPTAKSQAKQSSCETCKQTLIFMGEQCAKLSEMSRGQCKKSVAKANERCAFQCKAKK